MDHLIPAYGGTLNDLLAAPDVAERLKAESGAFPSWTLNERQLCDLELLLNGGYSPLTGFMNRADYASVLARARLADGRLWTLPVTLDVSAAFAGKLASGDRLALRDAEGFMLAVLTVEDLWTPDRTAEAGAVFGTADPAHPGVRELLEDSGDVYVGGKVTGLALPAHHDFETLRDTPRELRHLFERHGWRRVLAFHTCKPMHRLHRDLTLEAARAAGTHILIHPAVGRTKPGDLHYYARVHCYQAILRHYPQQMAMCSLLPLAVRMAGPREAVHNAIVRQNHGLSHLIIGPDHASPPESRHEGARFYPPYAAQEYLAAHQSELAIEMIPVEHHGYDKSAARFRTLKAIAADGRQPESFNEAALAEHLAHDREPPAWFTFPEVLDALRRVCPPRSRQGLTLFFTGLSGSGKSTLARILYAKFIEAGGRPVTMLDGDVVRQHLSRELGFSKEHRDINVRRIGFVASEITKNGGIAICAPIAPYTATRAAVRAMIEPHGGFLEIHVATPLEVCESRDRKGLYAKARAGLIPEFTGISDPYEAPERPEIRLDTSALSPMEAVQEVMLHLFQAGYMGHAGAD